MALTVTERLQYLLTFDTSSGIKSLQKFGDAADRELSKAEVASERAAASHRKMGAAMLSFAGVAGVGLFKMAQGANQAQQNVEALEQVVGVVESRKIEEWADGAAEAVGLSSMAAVEAATSFAQLGKLAGLAETDLAPFSQRLVGLAADLAAFKNVSPEKALQDIRSGFSGSVEVMRKYGIFLDDVTLKAALFEITGQKVTGTLTSQQRVLATNAELFRQGADQVGQWGRESDQLQGRIAVLQAEMTNLSNAIGEGVLPHVTSLMSGLAVLAGGMASLDESTGHLIGTAATLGVALAAVGGAFFLVRGSANAAKQAFLGMSGATQTAMVTTLALTAAVVVGSAIYEQHAKKKRELKRLTEGYTAAMKLEGEERDKAIHEEHLRNLATEDSINKAKALGLTFLDLAQYAEDGTGPVAELRDRLAEVNSEYTAEGEEWLLGLSRDSGIAISSLLGFVDSLEATRVAYGKATTEAEIYKQGQIDLVRAASSVRTEFDAVTQALIDHNAAIEEGKPTREELSDWYKLNTKISKALADVQGDLADEMRDAADAAIEQLEALEELNNQTDEMATSVLDWEDAQAQAAITIRDNTEALKDQTLTEEDRILIVNDTVRAQQRAADAAVEMARGMAEQQGITLTSTQALMLQNEALLANVATMEGPQRDALIEHIAFVNGLPPEVVTKIIADAPDMTAAEIALGEASETIKTSMKIETDMDEADTARAELGETVTFDLYADWKGIEGFINPDAFFYQMGLDSKAGLIAGWDNGGSFPAAVASTIGEGLAAGVNKARIRSPSRLFAEEIGEPLVQGIAAGIEAEDYRPGEALVSAIDKAEKRGINAAEEAADAVVDALQDRFDSSEVIFDSVWDGVDEQRKRGRAVESVSDAEQSVTDARLSLAESTQKVREATTQEELEAAFRDEAKAVESLSDAQQSLKDANLALAKATIDMVGNGEAQTAQWIETAKQAGLTDREIEALVNTYRRMIIAQEELDVGTRTAIDTKERDIAATKAQADAYRDLATKFQNLVTAGWLSEDDLEKVGGLTGSPEAQGAAMQAIIDRIDRYFGITPGANANQALVREQVVEPTQQYVFSFQGANFYGAPSRDFVAQIMAQGDQLRRERG